MKQLQKQNTELDERLKHLQQHPQEKDGLHRRYIYSCLLINNDCCHFTLLCVTVGLRNPDQCNSRNNQTLSHKNDFVEQTINKTYRDVLSKVCSLINFVVLEYNMK